MELSWSEDAQGLKPDEFVGLIGMTEVKIIPLTQSYIPATLY